MKYSTYDAINSHSIKILSLDDAPVIGHVLTEIFSKEYIFQHVKTVNEFNDMFLKFKPDIVLIDLNLPDGNGISVCKKIKNNNNIAQPFIIIMTSDQNEETVSKAYEIGIDDYIRKPFYPFELKSKIGIISDTIISKKRFKELYGGLKLFNQKLYKLTRIINRNINEITKDDILSSMEDAIQIIGADYCEVIVFGSPSHRQMILDNIKRPITIPYARLVQQNPSMLHSDFEHDNYKVKTKEGLLHVHVFKILFNQEKTGFVILQSLSPVPSESLDLIQLYLDFINMKGTDIQIKNRLKMEIEKERKDIARVRTIQVSLLPDFKDIPGFEIASSFIPMEEISGDFYDGFFLDEDTYQFVICDVCGHGMPSSYVGSAIRSIIRSISTDLRSLDKIISTLNTILTQTSIEIAYFATLFIWQINYKTCEMQYLSAGHPEALFYHSATKKLELLPSTGPIVGLFPETKYEVKKMSFYHGDILFVYTDGLIEATKPDSNEMFRLERLKAEFMDSTDCERSIDIIHNVLGSVYSFTDYDVVEDDVTIICMTKKSLCSEG